jgi:hypothetical protein
MILSRYQGSETVRAVAEQASDDKNLVVELLFAIDEHGKKHVSSPSAGVGATAKSSAPWWAGLGLVFGVVAGWSGDGGVLSALEDGLVTALAWGVFGLGAGALYGLWAGRSVSARRMRRVDALARPDTSAMLAWVDGRVTPETMSKLAKPGSDTLVVRFDSVGSGAVLDVSGGT